MGNKHLNSNDCSAAYEHSSWQYVAVAYH